MNFATAGRHDTTSILPRATHNHATVEFAGYAMAVPPIAAVLVGLILAAMIMGAVTIQVVAYMRRYSSDHKVTAVIVNVVFLWNAICLSLLGNALHHDLVTQFGKGRLHDHTLPQRYILLLITNVISRALVSFLAALLNAHLFESAFLGAILNLILASHLAITAYILHAVMQSFGLEIPIGREYPPLVEANTILSFGLEYTLCALFLWAYFRQQNQGRSENLAARHVFPAYLIMVLWSSGFAVGTWCNLPFLRALFGIPLGAVCNFALVALVYAQPSLLKLSPHHMSKQVVARAQITTSQDITIDSCHDGPLEIELMERLERKFPEEEESRSYHPDVENPPMNRSLQSQYRAGEVRPVIGT